MLTRARVRYVIPCFMWSSSSSSVMLSFEMTDCFAVQEVFWWTWKPPFSLWYFLTSLIFYDFWTSVFHNANLEFWKLCCSVSYSSLDLAVAGW
jgi:hypothetical protein